MVFGGRKIKKIRLYECGYCVNNISKVLKGRKKEVKKFPALVVLIQHSVYGNILYDTGYSELVYKNGIVSKIYNLLNKTYFKDKDLILNQIAEKEINKIIISHAHPDHIGALRFFENYELITSKEVLESIKYPKLKNLVFKNMVPKNLNNVNVLQQTVTDKILSKYFEEIYDVFGDGSILAVKLNGHSKGQIGIYLPEFKLFFVSDSSWGVNFNNVEDMKLIPKLIQNNFKEYSINLKKLNKLKNEYNDIKIIYSHEKVKEKIYE